MKKRLTSFFFVLALSFSLFSVSASAEFTSSDSRTLTDIYKVIQYLYLSPASWQRYSVIGFLERIFEAIPSNLSANFSLQGGDGTNSILDGIRDYSIQTYNYLSGTNIAGNLGDIKRNIQASADRLLSTNTALDVISQKFDVLSGDNSYSAKIYKLLGGDIFDPFFNGPILQYLIDIHGEVRSFTQDAILSTDEFGEVFYTPYHYIRQLANVLANDEDKAIRDAQKENTEVAKDKFLSGQSGKTSLGKGDFSNASDVGGALNDTFNMGGAAKVSDFLSGFGSAGTESQAWFSQTTANNLNAVEAGDGTQGVSSFADDGESMVDVDPDPYNMADIFSRYDWLEGVNMDG